MAAVIETRAKYVQRQLQNIESFLTQPKGLFETLDSMIKTFRMANRATLSAITKSAGTIKGQYTAQGPVRRIIKRIRQRIGG